MKEFKSKYLTKIDDVISISETPFILTSSSELVVRQTIEGVLADILIGDMPKMLLDAFIMKLSEEICNATDFSQCPMSLADYVPYSINDMQHKVAHMMEWCLPIILGRMAVSTDASFNPAYIFNPDILYNNIERLVKLMRHYFGDLYEWDDQMIATTSINYYSIFIKQMLPYNIDIDMLTSKIKKKGSSISK